MINDGPEYPWVPRSDREPDRDALYLVFAPSLDAESPLLVNAWYDKTFGWSMLPQVWLDAITHWAPLPKWPLTEAELERIAT